MLRFLILKKDYPSLISFVVYPPLDFFRYMEIFHGSNRHEERYEK